MLSCSRLILCATVLFGSSCLLAGEIILTVVNVRNSDGYLLAALHDREATFPNEGDALMYAKVKAVAGKTLLRFSVDAPGIYAVVLFHDENDNGVLDTNLIGIPVEGYGFTNNARGTFGPPDFQDAIVRVDGGVVTQSIVLTY